MIRILYLVAMALVVLCVMPCHSTATPTAQQISTYQKNMESHQEDLIAIGKSASGTDAEIAINLIDLTNQYSIQLAHIQDLLLIEALIQTPADRKRIKPVIDRGIRSVADRIQLSIRQVNLGIANSKNQGIIATATKLRDHLRELRELLENHN